MAENQPDNYTINIIYPLRLWNNTHDLSAQQHTWLFHSIALDMKVSYKLASYTHSAFITKEMTAVQQSLFFSAVFQVVKAHKWLTSNPAQLLNTSAIF